MTLHLNRPLNLFKPVAYICIAFATVMIGACSILPKGAPPAEMFTLNAPHIQHNTHNTRNLPSVKVLLPQAASGLETSRIALRSGNNRIDYYRDIRWADNSTTLLQSLLVESFDNSQAFKAVANDLMDLDTDYNLLVDIRDFQIEFSNDKPYANIRFVTKLIRNSPQTLVMTRTYHIRENAAANDLKSIMQAFDNGYQKAATAIVNDTINALGSRAKK